MRLVRVVAPHFVAGFETDGIVRRAAPILKTLIGKSDDYAREVFARYGWKASVIGKPCGECHLKPDEVCDICGAINRQDRPE